jgi:hypothetical protein
VVVGGAVRTSEWLDLLLQLSLRLFKGGLATEQIPTQAMANMRQLLNISTGGLV